MILKYIQRIGEWAAMLLSLAAFGVFCLEFNLWMEFGEWKSLGLIDLLPFSIARDSCFDATSDFDGFWTCMQANTHAFAKAILPHFEEGAKGWIGPARLLDAFVDWWAVTNAVYTLLLLASLIWFGVKALEGRIDSDGPPPPAKHRLRSRRP